MLLKNRKGATLVEIIIGIALLAVVIVGIFPLFSATMKINKENRRRQEIHENIVKEIEAYRSKNYKEIMNDGEFEYIKLSNDKSYEIITKIEFEKDDLAGNGNYGYLQMQVLARDVKSGEKLDKVETYISNNGDDTTIFVRIKNEWQDPNKSTDWIVDQRVTLENILNHTTENKETDVLGKVLYLDPPMGRYKIDLNQGKYKISDLSPDKLGDEFSVKKGCTTYVEYWMYEPIKIKVSLGRGIDYRLMDSDRRILHDLPNDRRTYLTPRNNRLSGAIRPLGIGNSSYYTIKAGKGQISEKKMKRIYDVWVGRPWYSRLEYKRWLDGKGHSNYWQKGTMNWKSDGNGGWKGWMYYRDQQLEKTVEGKWVDNPLPINLGAGISTTKTFLYEFEYLDWMPNYEGIIYYKNSKGNYEKLVQNQLELTKNDDEEFVFLLNKDKKLTLYVGSNDLNIKPINYADKIDLEIQK